MGSPSFVLSIVFLQSSLLNAVNSRLNILLSLHFSLSANFYLFFFLLTVYLINSFIENPKSGYHRPFSKPHKTAENVDVGRKDEISGSSPSPVPLQFHSHCLAPCPADDWSSVTSEFNGNKPTPSTFIHLDFSWTSIRCLSALATSEHTLLSGLWIPLLPDLSWGSHHDAFYSPNQVASAPSWNVSSQSKHQLRLTPISAHDILCSV